MRLKFLGVWRLRSRTDIADVGLYLAVSSMLQSGSSETPAVPAQGHAETRTQEHTKETFT